jgi:hypothetical protein
LTHLKIEDSTRTTNGDPTLSIQHIIRECPTLIYFELNSRYPINYDSIPSAIDNNNNNTSPSVMTMNESSNNNTTILDDDIANTSTTTNQPSSGAIPVHDHLSARSSLLCSILYREQLYTDDRELTRLKGLVLKVAVLSAKDLRALLSSIPQLDTLDLQINEDIVDVWIQGCNAETMEEIGTGLCKISNLSIGMRDDIVFRLLTIQRKDLLDNAVQGKTLEERLKNFQMFVDMISRRCSLICELNFIVYEGRSPRSTLNQFKASIKGGKMKLEYIFGFFQYSDANVILLSNLLAGGSLDKNLQLPALYSLQVHIQSTLGDIYLDIDRILINAVTNCKYLTNIKIIQSYKKCYELTSRLYSTLQGANPLTPEKVEEFLSTTATKSHNHLTTFRIMNTQLTSRLIRALKRSFRNIRQLSLRKWSFSYDSNHNVELNLKGIRKLRRFKMNVNGLDFCSQRHVLFQIEFVDNASNEDAVYYKCEEDKSSKALELTQITEKFVNSYNRVTSLNTIVFTIRFRKIDTLMFYNSTDSANIRGIIQLSSREATLAETEA